MWHKKNWHRDGKLLIEILLSSFPFFGILTVPTVDQKMKWLQLKLHYFKLESCIVIQPALFKPCGEFSHLFFVLLWH